jgi:hypothetical protein
MAATQLLANYFDGYFQQEGMYQQMWPDKEWKSYIQDHVAKSLVCVVTWTRSPDGSRRSLSGCAIQAGSHPRPTRATPDRSGTPAFRGMYVPDAVAAKS